MTFEKDVIDRLARIETAIKPLSNVACLHPEANCPKGVDDDVKELKEDVKSIDNKLWGVIAGILIIVIGGLIVWGAQTTIAKQLVKVQPQVEVQIDER